MSSRISPSFYQKTVTGFIPASENARLFHVKTKLGATVELKGRRPRNVKHHRKLFALLSIVADNSDDFTSPDDVLIALKAALGYGRWITPVRATREIFIPDSIRFERMPQDDFEAFYDSALIAVRRWWIDVSDDELREAIEHFSD